MFRLHNRYNVIPSWLLMLYVLCAAAGGCVCTDRSRVTPSPHASAFSERRGQSPYSINGIFYYPIPSAEGFAETGTASWYGGKFHGRPTASGEPYDKHGWTAAHKILPLGTYVKVTHMKNGKSVIVRVNDRGPFVKGRIIDLTRSAAQKLDMLTSGTAPVRVEAVLPAHKHRDGEDVYWETTPVPDFRHGRFAVQMGAFAALENARSLQQELSELYTPVKITSSESGQKGDLHRVMLGDFSDLIEAHLTAGQLEAQGYPAAFVVAVEKQGDPVN